MNAAGPLFACDVERLDRQDDRAAARAFLASTLDFQMKEYEGYLFTFLCLANLLMPGRTVISATSPEPKWFYVQDSSSWHGGHILLPILTTRSM